MTGSLFSLVLTEVYCIIPMKTFSKKYKKAVQYSDNFCLKYLSKFISFYQKSAKKVRFLNLYLLPRPLC
jgi:hypothetical protein